MCVFRNMIVHSGVFVKSLMNIRTKKNGRHPVMPAVFYRHRPRFSAGDVTNMDRYFSTEMASAMVFS